jgi:hypothetical protein
MSKIGADRQSNLRGASILVNFDSAITIAGIPMTAPNGIAPHIAVGDGPLVAKTKARRACPPLQHSLCPAPRSRGNHGGNTVAAPHRPGPDIAEGVPASSDFLGEGVDAWQ